MSKFKKGKVFGVGLVGAGEFTTIISQGIHESAEIKLLGVFDKNMTKAKAVAKKHKAKVFANFNDLINEPYIDIVAINTPHYLHAPMVLKALKVGKHIFCEKPFALSILDINKIFNSAKHNNKLIYVDFVLRQSTIYRELLELLPTLGKLRAMTVINYASEAKIKSPWYWDYKKSGGWFFTSEIHFFDLFGAFSDFPEIHRISAVEYKNKKTNHTTAIQCFVGTKSGQVLNIYHLLDTKPKDRKTIVNFQFEHGNAQVQGWVPTSLSVSGAVKLSKILKFNREKQYHTMVAEGFNHLVREIRANSRISLEYSNEIVWSHKLALKANKYKREIIK